MIIKAKAISELIESGKLRVGSYVGYVPDYAKYTPNKKNTGFEGHTLFNNRLAPWVVVYVDESSGKVDIMPCENLAESIYLNGIVGYVNGPKELNVIASKLGSNSELGIIARCPTIEDMNKIFKPVFSEKNVKRYAYYPDGHESGECEFNGNNYIKTCCTFDSEFYNCDGGGVEEKSIRRNVLCRTPRYGEPVFITETYCWYNMTSNILQKGTFWLASQSEWLDSSLVNFGVGFAGSWYVGAEILCDSYDLEYDISKGVRAIVTLEPTVRLGVCENMDGRFPRTAFSLIV